VYSTIHYIPLRDHTEWFVYRMTPGGWERMLAGDPLNETFLDQLRNRTPLQLTFREEHAQSIPAIALNNDVFGSIWAWSQNLSPRPGRILSWFALNASAYVKGTQIWNESFGIYVRTTQD
jgi:hypothetical protein